MTYKEKQETLELLQRYAQAKPDLTLGQYQRLVNWLSGMSYREIGQEEGVSAQAIAQSVKRDLIKVLRFANSYDKR